MSADILRFALAYAQIALILALALACWRMLRGPRAQDRVFALDLLYLHAMLVVLVTGILHGSDRYFEIALLIALFGFVSSAAMAKFILRGEVIE